MSLLVVGCNFELFLRACLSHLRCCSSDKVDSDTLHTLMSQKMSFSGGLSMFL